MQRVTKQCQVDQVSQHNNIRIENLQSRVWTAICVIEIFSS
jgi:hypothetical protein